MSIFLLCEHGISYYIANKLKERNITIEAIKENPDVLDVCMKSVKKEEILEAVNKIGNVTEEAIYDLAEYGVSMVVVEKLIKQNMTIEKLKGLDKEKFKQMQIDGKAYSMLHNALLIYLGDIALKKYNKYTKILQECIEKNAEELDLQEKELYESFLEYINKKYNKEYRENLNEIYCIQNKTILKEDIDNFVSKIIYKGSIPSIFTICDYGITIMLAEKIHEAGITIYSILDDFTVLSKCLGSSKSQDVIDAVKQIEDYEKESIYLLCEYRLSKNIIEQMNEEHITMLDLKSNDSDTLNEKYNIGKSASKTIYQSLRRYIGMCVINKEKEKLVTQSKDYSSIIKDTIMSLKKDNITLAELKNAEVIYRLNISEEEINNAIKKLQDKNVIKYKDNIISLKYENLDEAIEKYITKYEHNDIIKRIFTGKNQATVAVELNRSRERIRQVFDKACAKLPAKLDEDINYKEIFCKYNWEKECFCDVYNVKENVYYYLQHKYKNEKGQEDLEKILGTDYLTKEQEEKLKNYLKLVEYNDMLIKEEKYSLLSAILQEDRIQYTITDLIKKYNEVIKEYGFSNLEELDNIRNVETSLARRKCIIASNKKRYRYYDYELLTQEDIRELTNLLDVEDGVYYTDYFFRENRELMNRLNIIDEYELYNMLKKYVKNSNIEFLITPIIAIGYNSKEEFFVEKMNNLAPISLDELAKFLNIEYGYKIDSVKSYIMSEFSRYMTNGIINTEEKLFNKEQLNILQQNLTEKVYSIKKVKEIQQKLFGNSCTEYIRSINFEKIGYRIRDQYIIKTNAGAVEDIFEEILLENDVLDMNICDLKNFGRTLHFMFYKLTGENRLIKYDDNLYYTENWLKKSGITREIISNFKQLIYNSFESDELFTLFNIKQKGLIDEFESLKVNDTFIESIMKTIEGIKYVSIENNIAFFKSDIKFFNKADFIEKIILDNNISKVKDIKELLLEKYNMDIGLSKIKELIDLKKYEMEEVVEEDKIEEESIENASDDYSIVMCFKYFERVFGIGIQKNFSEDRNSEFLKRVDNSLNTLTQKEKAVVILKNGLKDGRTRTAQEVSDEIGIVSINTVSSIEKRATEKLKDEKRTKILRTYFNLNSTKLDNDTAEFILGLLDD